MESLTQLLVDYGYCECSYQHVPLQEVSYHLVAKQNA